METETEIQPSDDMISVPLDGEPDAPDKMDAEPGTPAASVNLVSDFTTEELSKMAEIALDDYDADQLSREDHMKQMRRWYELYASVMKVKSWPFQNAANVNEPLLTYSVLQVHGRLFDMLLPAKGNIYSSQAVRISDDQEIDRAERTEIFINWYIREKIPEYRMSYDATFWQLLIFGSAFRYFYWDYTQNRICAEWVGIDDMVVPYKCKVTDPSMRGVPRYTLVRWMSIFDIEERGDSGEYENTDKVKAGQQGDEKRSEFKEAVDQVDGKAPPSREFLEDEDRQVLEQHRKIRTPNDPTRHPAFDGKPHPVIITIDEASRTVLRVVLREEDDPSDAKRFAKETQEYQQLGGFKVDQLSGAVTSMKEPKKTRQREVCFFTHYMCFQGEGFYGLGLGNFIGPMNEAQNTIINQQIDRHTVNNAGGGLISRQMRFQRGPITRQPGLYTEVDAPPQAMKDGLQSWPMVPPDPDGRFFLSHIEEMSNKVSGAGDTLSGEPVGSNETARAAMSRTEQAQKQISVLAARIIGYMTCDARIIWRLFATYLDEEEYHDVVDSTGKPRNMQIGRADFIADARVLPTADPRLTSHAQRLQEAMDFFNFVCGNQLAPELAQNPQLRHAATEAVLYAMDRHEMIEMLAPQPPPPPPPVPQWHENAEFLRDHDSQVNPADDDDAHLIEMQSFTMDPLGYAMLSPQARKMFDQHRRNHFAAKLEKEKQADEQRRQAQAALLGPPGGGPGALAPGAPNAPPHQLSGIGTGTGPGPMRQLGGLGGGPPGGVPVGPGSGPGLGG